MLRSAGLRSLRAAGGALAWVIVVSIGLAACVTPPPPPGARTPAGAAGPSTPLSLAEYQRGDMQTMRRRFAQRIEQRYAAQAPFSVVLADLRAAQFRCVRSRHTLGDPPAQVCRRSVNSQACAHAWQVFLYDDPGAPARLARVRGVYDRVCDDDPLLGGRG